LDAGSQVEAAGRRVDEALPAEDGDVIEVREVAEGEGKVKGES